LQKPRAFIILFMVLFYTSVRTLDPNWLVGPDEQGTFKRTLQSLTKRFSLLSPATRPRPYSNLSADTVLQFDDLEQWEALKLDPQLIWWYRPDVLEDQRRGNQTTTTQLQPIDPAEPPPPYTPNKRTR
jgi:hypothetical protein